MSLKRGTRTQVVEGNSARIHHLRVRELRKIAKARQRVGEAARGTKRDIIGDYSTFASKIYAPIKREGIAYYGLLLLNKRRRNPKP